MIKHLKCSIPQEQEEVTHVSLQEQEGVQHVSLQEHISEHWTSAQINANKWEIYIRLLSRI